MSEIGAGRPGVMAKATAALLLAAGPLCLSAARHEIVTVPSPAMAKDFPCSVYLPNDYAETDAPRPIVYLLHGSNGDHLSLASPETSNVVDRLGFVAVCPWGGHSWWMDAPAASNMLFETHFVRELMPFVEARYRVRRDRQGRAIAGTSMGGFGAHYLGFRHKDLFSAVGSIYGAFDLTVNPADAYGRDHIFGPIAQGDGGRTERSILNLLGSLKNGDLFLVEVVGTSDFTLEANRRFHSALTERAIAHTYVEIRGLDHQASRHSDKFAWPALDMICDLFAAHFAERSKNIWEKGKQ